MTAFPDSPGGAPEIATSTLRSMVGHCIERVCYRMASGTVAELDQGDDSLVHEVDHAVVISTKSADIVLEWCIRNYDEFLNVAATPDQGASAAVTRVVEVTNLPQWNMLRESAISGFGVATHHSEDGTELPWALRINVESGESVVVALGELRDGKPTYQPDNLLAIFQPEIAQSLQVLDAADSAWGTDLHL